MALTKAKISNLDTSIEFFQDPIILLNEKSTLANIDIGFVFNRNGGTDTNVAIYWNETTKSFTLAYTANNGIVNSNISVNSYANITVGNIYSSGYYYADGSPFVTSSASNVAIQNEGNTLTTAVGTINFTGDGFTAIAVGNVVTVNFTGGGGAGYGNTNVAAYLNTYNYSPYSNVNVANYLTTATITTTGNITAQKITGNISVTGNITSASSNVIIEAGSYTSVFDDQGNVAVPSLFASGNIQTAGYLFGNGAFLTGVVTGSSYGNVQVATYLPTYTGTVGASFVNSTGNVAAVNLIGSLVNSNQSNVTTLGNLTTLRVAGNALIYGATTTGNLTVNSGEYATFAAASNVNAYQTSLSVNTGLGSLAVGWGTTASPGTFMSMTASGGTNQINSASRDFKINFTALTNALLLYGANGSAVFNSTVTSTSTTTGAMSVVGGVGIGGNLNLGTAGAVGGQFHTVVGNITQTSSGGAVYINTSGNILAAQLNVGQINSTGNILGTGGIFNSLTVNGNQSVTGYLNVTGNVIAAVAEVGSVESAGVIYANSTAVGSSATTGALITAGGIGVGKDSFFNGNVTIGGNLFVNGNVSVFNTNNLSINDSLIYLADDNTADVIDIGFVSSFTNPGYQHTGFVRDASDGTWKLFANVVSEPTTTVDFTNATYSNLLIGNLLARQITTTGINSAGFINTSGNVSGATVIAGTMTTTGTLTAAVINSTGNILGTGGIFNSLTVNGNESVTGYLNVTGNIIAATAELGSVESAGVIYANSTASTTNTTSGAVIVAGGIGVAGNAYVGGRVGFTWANNVSSVYQIFNSATNSLDTVFG